MALGTFGCPSFWRGEGDGRSALISKSAPRCFCFRMLPCALTRANAKPSRIRLRFVLKNGEGDNLLRCAIFRYAGTPFPAYVFFRPIFYYSVKKLRRCREGCLLQFENIAERKKGSRLRFCETSDAERLFYFCILTNHFECGK